MSFRFLRQVRQPATAPEYVTNGSSQGRLQWSRAVPHGGAAVGMERLRQGAMHLAGAVSDVKMQHLHVSLDRHSSSSAQERLAALKRTYDNQQKFSGKV